MSELRALIAPLRMVAREALAAYGDAEVGRLRGHGENTVFAVRGAPWMLRVHRVGYHEDRTLLGELELLRALHKAGFTVPLPIEARDGSVLQVCQGRRVTVLKRVEGSIRRQVGGDRAERLGRTLAELHAFAYAWTPPPAFHRSHWDLRGILGPGSVWGDLETGGVDPGLVNEVRAQLFHVLRGLDATAIPLHFDLHPGNVLWTGNEPALIDWDDSGLGHPLFDLAIPWRGLAPVKKARFLRGYGSPVDPALLQAARLALDSRTVGWLHARRQVPKLGALLPGYRERFVASAAAWLAEQPG